MHNHHNPHIHGITIKTIESRLLKAVEYHEKFPDYPVAALYRDFDILRQRLRNRIQGIPPKKGTLSPNTKFTILEEEVLYNYIDYLDNINLAVRLEYITKVANLVFKSRTSLEEFVNSPPYISINWALRFI